MKSVLKGHAVAIVQFWRS